MRVWRAVGNLDQPLWRSVEAINRYMLSFCNIKSYLTLNPSVDCSNSWLVHQDGCSLVKGTGECCMRAGKVAQERGVVHRGEIYWGDVHTMRTLLVRYAQEEKFTGDMCTQWELYLWDVHRRRNLLGICAQEEKFSGEMCTWWELYLGDVHRRRNLLGRCAHNEKFTGEMCTRWELYLGDV